MTLYKRIKTMLFGEDAPVVPRKPETCHICGKTLEIGDNVSFIVRDIVIDETNTTTYLAYIHSGCKGADIIERGTDTTRGDIDRINERLIDLYEHVSSDDDIKQFDGLLTKIEFEIDATETVFEE